MTDPRPLLQSRLGAEAPALSQLVAEVRADRARLPVLFPGLPRRFGKQALGGGPADLPAAIEGWRRCDAAAALLLLEAAATDQELTTLHAHGDLEERIMVLRALALLPLGRATAQLLGEVQRTNMVLHLEAAVCDSDLLVRAVRLPDFGADAGNRLLLKVAFLDLPLARLHGAAALANPELSRMLQDLATEREAAGRAVWRDTWRMIGRAPCPGSTARLIGGLEHGDDGVRLAAAEGLLSLNRPDLVPFARERLPREPRPAIRAVLQRLVAASGDPRC